MSKVVHFDGKQAFGKDFEILDTYTNVQLVNAGLIRLFNKISDYEAKNDSVTLMGYQDVISSVVLEETAKLLGLSKADANKLKDISYSDVFDFYAEAADKFLAMTVPSIDSIKDVMGIDEPAVADQDDPKPKETV
ncbi:hypothetical protein [Limosilactobacillus fermentum]|uniref:hypothetical protein n=1 Tax=Limosilactobacillus fermentum TaxID=1613 RepID=UPI0021F1C533|nr:hypothetical protein [Limosilactobacillus fermentum]